jgi:60 kDa SS-A/Ro ribonucleoprotein
MEIDEIRENDERQIPNSVGGFVWKVDDMKRLHRFLVLGSDTPTYYIEDRKLGIENARAISNLLQAGRGLEVVNDIRTYSVEGRTVKQQPMMLALALCAREGDLKTKRKAYEVLPEVCRIPTHLFMFVAFCETFSKGPDGGKSTGWGRAHRNGLKKWYISKSNDPMKLAKDVTKYQKREGWSHRDVARLMHLKPEGQDIRDELRVIMKYVVRGWKECMQFCFPADRSVPHMGIGEGTNAVLEFLKAVEDVKGVESGNDSEVVRLINTYNLVREHIPTPFLKSLEVRVFGCFCATMVGLSLTLLYLCLHISRYGGHC